MTPPKRTTLAISVACFVVSLLTAPVEIVAAFVISAVGLANLLAGCYLKNY